MALYIAPARRRRRVLVTAGVALALGLLLGAIAGRVTAPTLDDRISSVRGDARETAAGLRVIALHDEAGTGAEGEGDQGADLVLERTRTELDGLFDRAPWLGSDARAGLFDELDALGDSPDPTGAAFGEQADALAGHIETTFGAA
ncbi:MAG TPA: hypothetical protein VGO78_11060 [Acidimicrobiales bacterium]|nr:hypothetical protein [Acidimicrobiales bacterium]